MLDWFANANCRGLRILAIVALGVLMFAIAAGPTEAATGGFAGKPTAPLFTAQTPPTTATLASAYSYQFVASGNPAPTYARWSGSLPPGMTLNTTTGVLAGTPTLAGSYAFRVSASNSMGTALTPTITISVSGTTSCTPPVWTAFTPPAGRVGQAYSYQFAATGNPAPSYRIVGGSFPPVLALDSSTGRVSGNPLWAGTWVVHLYAVNSCGGAYQFSITISVS